LLVALKVPAVQLAQVRSLVVEPAPETRWPARHVVMAAQTVAGSASWSQVPVAHVTAGAVPPAQYVPSTQAIHVGGVVAEPGAV
jgi:hypothetical protein